MYCRAEEFRSVKFFVSTVGKADRQARRRSQARIQADRLERSTLPGRKLGSIAGLWAGHSISTQYGGKSEEERSQYSTQETGDRREERGEKRYLGDSLVLELNK